MFKKILNQFLKLKHIFIKDSQLNNTNYIEDQLSKAAKEVRKNPALIEKNNKRFLAFSDTDCALILHAENQCEVVFTKMYDGENQNFTMNEELLMALAIFLKQPGFGEMLISEFQKAALNNSSMFEDKEKIKNKGKNS